MDRLDFETDVINKVSSIVQISTRLDRSVAGTDYQKIDSGLIRTLATEVMYILERILFVEDEPEPFAPAQGYEPPKEVGYDWWVIAEHGLPELEEGERYTYEYAWRGVVHVSVDTDANFLASDDKLVANFRPYGGGDTVLRICKTLGV